MAHRSECFGDLAEVVLEDSWVFRLYHTSTVLLFELDVVLTQRHREYRTPPPGEHACFRHAQLHIASRQPIMLNQSAAPPATDASGSIDYGHIDVFRHVRHDPAGLPMWELDGDWGEALVVDPTVELRLL